MSKLVNQLLCTGINKKVPIYPLKYEMAVLPANWDNVSSGKEYVFGLSSTVRRTINNLDILKGVDVLGILLDQEKHRLTRLIYSDFIDLVYELERAVYEGNAAESIKIINKIKDEVRA